MDEYGNLTPEELALLLEYQKKAQQAQQTHQLFTDPYGGVAEAFALGVHEMPGQIADLIDVAGQLNPVTTLNRVIRGGDVTPSMNGQLKQGVDEAVNLPEVQAAYEQLSPEFTATPALLGTSRFAGQMMDPTIIMGARPAAEAAELAARGAVKGVDNLMIPTSSAPWELQRGMIGGKRGASPERLKKLQDAYKMQQDGVPDGEIAERTGWWLGDPDGKPRYEFSDADMKLKPEVQEALQAQRAVMNRPLEQVIEHPELFESYPELATVPTSLTPSNYGPSGSFSGGGEGMRLEAKGSPLTDPFRENLSVLHGLTHETQHAVDKLEGFPRGGSPQQFGYKLPPELKKKADAARDVANAIENEHFIPVFKKKAESKSADEVIKMYGEMQDEGVRYEIIKEAAGEEVAEKWYEANTASKPINYANEPGVLGPHKQYQLLAGEQQANLSMRRRTMDEIERDMDPFYEMSPTARQTEYENMIYHDQTQFDKPQERVLPDFKPQKTKKAYKLFRVDPNRPGELFPLFVNAKDSVPVGKWVAATSGEKAGEKVKSKIGKLAYRPGWHSGDLPIAKHIGGKNTKADKAPSWREPDTVWAEVEVADDVDWQTEAFKRAQLKKNGDPILRTAHITDKIPEGGNYKYKTNPNMEGEWIISGEMKVNRVLDDAEVEKINKAAGTADLPRRPGTKGLWSEKQEMISPLEGAPDQPGMGQNDEIMDLAAQYAKENQIDYNPLTNYQPVDEKRAKEVADAFDKMPHAPDDPQVKASYEALAAETLAQYDTLVKAGYKPRWIKPGADPYGDSPWNAVRDINENRTLAIYPTKAGFGSDDAFDASSSPLLADSGRTIEGEPATFNDLFRFVHDVFGHAKHGVGFRAIGEENAFQSHAGMFSPLARRALATETRGQNSWLNYGPHGEANRTAKTEDTVFADQKTGLLPAKLTEAGVSTVPPNPAFKGSLTPDDMLRLTHYSGKAGLDEIDPAQYGTGLSGRTIQERNRATDPNFVQRSYFGLTDAETNPYRKEAGLGDVQYQAEVDPRTIYDPVADPLKLWNKADPTASEKAIFDQGYAGYYANSRLGKTVTMFDKVPVKENPMNAPLKSTPGSSSSKVSTRTTVRKPLRKAFPGIYKPTDVLLKEAKEAWKPESPALKELFGVTRKDLDRFTRQLMPNNVEIPVKEGTGRGAQHVAQVTTGPNTRRLQGVLDAAAKDDDFAGAYGWYWTKPLQDEFVRILGPNRGPVAFDEFMQMGSAVSPGSDVGKEIQRTSVAHMAHGQGDLDKFISRDIMPPGRDHAYHSTAHASGLNRMLQTGKFFDEQSMLNAPKTPNYYYSKMGQQRHPTADAHFVRGVGLPDVRPTGDAGSIKALEAGPVREWFQNTVNEIGQNGSPAQALMWNILAPQTGVKSKVGAPFIEIFADEVVKRANKLGRPAKDVLEDVIKGKEYLALAPVAPVMHPDFSEALLEEEDE